MISLTKTLILLYLIINIVCVTCRPKRRFGFKGKSKNLKIKEPQESEFDTQVKCCQLEVYLLFPMETGLENFLHAFLNINEESLFSSEHLTVSIQDYYYYLFKNARDNQPPSVLTPQQFCQQNYGYKGELCNKCISNIVAAGCKANVMGNACILHLYLAYKKPDEFYPGSVPGTGGLSDEDLSKAYIRGIKFPDDYTDENLLDDYYKKTGQFGMLSRNAPSSSTSATSSQSSFSAQEEGNYLEYIQHRNEISTSLSKQAQRENDLLETRYRSYGIRDIPYANIREEFKRREPLTKVYHYYYAMYLHNEIQNNSGWIFDNRHEFCEKFIERQQTNS